MLSMCGGILQRHADIIAAYGCRHWFVDCSVGARRRRVVPYGWLSTLLGIVVAIMSLWLVVALIEALTTRKLRRGICPKCGAKLSRTGSGFYDGIVPSPWELLIYALAIALAFGVDATVSGHGR